MIREALQYLFAEAQKAAGFHRLPDVPGEHTTRVLIDGKIQEFEHDPPAINAAVFDIPSMLEAVNRYQLTGDSATVWVRPEIVVIVLDGRLEDYQVDRVRFTPGLNPVCNVLSQMASKHYTHVELLDLLRFDLHGVQRDESFDLAIKNLKITTSTDEERQQTRTADAMGKSVRAEVTGQNTLPETVMFEFPAYPGLPEVDVSLTVTCSVQTIPLDKKFRVVPLTGELDRIRRQAAQGLLAVIKDTVPTAAILMGNPNLDRSN